MIDEKTRQNIIKFAVNFAGEVQGKMGGAKTAKRFEHYFILGSHDFWGSNGLISILKNAGLDDDYPESVQIALDAIAAQSGWSRE